MDLEGACDVLHAFTLIYLDAKRYRSMNDKDIPNGGLYLILLVAAKTASPMR